MQDTVIRNIVRLDDELVAFFADAAAADVHEAMGKTGAMAPGIESTAGRPELCGLAVTARIPPGDNTMVHVASQVAEPDDVLVFESETTRTATWGELATRNAQRKGIGGVVSGGNIRDVAAIDELGFPVFSKAVSQSGARKEGNGSVNVPVSVGEVLVRPGDIVVGDRDGVTVVPQELALEVRAATEKRRRTEDKIQAKIEDGEPLPGILGTDELLAENDSAVVEDTVDYSQSVSQTPSPKK